MRSVFLVLLGMFIFAKAAGNEPYHTTAFIAPEGSIDCLLSYSTYSADHFQNKKGKRLPTYNELHAENYNLYAEYAFNDQNSFTFNGSYFFGKTEMDGNKCGFKDFEIGWKHFITGEDISSLTFQWIAIIPYRDYKPLITYGKWGTQAGLLYSRFFTFCDRLGWYDLGLAYRYYQGFPSDQVRGNCSLGIHAGTLFGWEFTWIGSCFLEYGIYNGKDGYQGSQIYLNPNYRLVKGQLECRFRSTCFPYATITLGAFTHIFERQISQGKGFIGGAWIDY